MNTELAGVDGHLRALYRRLPPAGAHPDEETWVALASGALSPAARTALADHVGTCPECAHVFRAVHALEEEARRRGMSLPDSSAPPQGAPRWMLLAAALVAGLGIVSWLGIRSTAPDDGPPQQAAPAGPTSTSPAAPAQPATPPIREWALALAAPPVELPARYALVTRGTGADSAFLEAFGKAIAPYREGAYETAATALADVAARFPDVPEAAFYLGVARVMAGDAAGARAPLARAERAESLGDAARWFGAIAAERSGAPAEADAMLANLCRSAGSYRERACAAASGRAVPEP